MAKLTKYSSFETLKADVKPIKASSSKNEKLQLEFKSFLSLLQKQLSVKKKAETAHGK
jgi:hypothetical protein